MLTLGRCHDVKEPRLPSSALFFCALFVITFTSVTLTVACVVMFSFLNCTLFPFVHLLLALQQSLQNLHIQNEFILYLQLAHYQYYSFLGQGQQKVWCKQPCFHSLETSVIFSCFSGCLLSTLLFTCTHMCIHIYSSNTSLMPTVFLYIYLTTVDKSISGWPLECIPSILTLFTLILAFSSPSQNFYNGLPTSGFKPSDSSCILSAN